MNIIPCHHLNIILISKAKLVFRPKINHIQKCLFFYSFDDIQIIKSPFSEFKFINSFAQNDNVLKILSTQYSVHI